MNLLKMYYHDPRPYFVAEYGSPSGHAILAGFCLIFFLDRYDNKESRQLTKFIAVLFSLIWIILVGVSRVYVGAHAIN